MKFGISLLLARYFDPQTHEAQNVFFTLFNIGNVQALNYEKDPQIGITHQGNLMRLKLLNQESDKMTRSLISSVSQHQHL